MATDEDGTTPIDVLLFLPAALEQFREGRDTPDASSILAALCTAVGHMRHELVRRPRFYDRGWRGVRCLLGDGRAKLVPEGAGSPVA